MLNTVIINDDLTEFADLKVGEFFVSISDWDFYRYHPKTKYLLSRRKIGANQYESVDSKYLIDRRTNPSTVPQPTKGRCINGLYVYRVKC